MNSGEKIKTNIKIKKREGIVESIEEKEARLEKMVEEFERLKKEYDLKEKMIDEELAKLEEELRKISEEESKNKVEGLEFESPEPEIKELEPKIENPEPEVVSEAIIEPDVTEQKLEQLEPETSSDIVMEPVSEPEVIEPEVVSKMGHEKTEPEIKELEPEIENPEPEVMTESEIKSVEEIIPTKLKEKKENSFKNFIDKLSTSIKSKFYLINNIFRKEKKQSRTSSEPKQIKIEEIIDENISIEEKEKIQKEFPGQNVNKVIENQIVEQINNKMVIPFEKRKDEHKLKRKIRKIRNYLLLVFVSASTFEMTSVPKTKSHSDVFSYDNIRIDSLKDWGNVKMYEDDINKLENLSVITKFHENSNDKYIVVDKQNGKAHYYQGDNLIKSYNVCLGDSIGDEQTKLKSIYRRKFEDSDSVFHRRPRVSIDEATYVKNGERYIKPGYEAFTYWNEGNMKTGAGIYTISNKGPFLDDFGIFLKNERGLQVATSLHVNSHLKSEAPDFRFTNGCVGFSKEDLMELYRRVRSGEKVYIMPEESQNKFQIIDGELRFTSNKQDVNRTIRPYESRPIVIQAENPTDDAKVWLLALSENKEKLMKLYPTISNNVYNELAKISYGIMGQESSFGTYGGPRGQYGRVKDIGLSSIGLEPSVGAGQVRLENVEPRVKKAFNMKRNKDLFKTKMSAIATMSILLDNYLYVTYNGKGDQYKELVVLKYNVALEAKKIVKDGKSLEELGPKTKSYVKKVLNYSELASVYTTNANENYYNPDWDYGHSDQLAANY